ncbi:hypothetical protein tb265_48150 [Gemmatimonadetes bacterium T265]|nr:hypothetical protein tb265_48150 [Gemmatimonadetes bacterium T265]
MSDVTRAAAPDAGRDDQRGENRPGENRPGGNPPPDHPAPHRDRVHPLALWVGLFGVPVLWSLQTLVDYPVLSHFCYPQRIPLARPEAGGVWTTALVVSLVALAGSLAVGAVALRSWRATRDEHQHGAPGGMPRATSVGEVGEGRTRFMAFAGVMISGLFLLGVVLNGVPLFVVPTCR